MRGDHGYRLRDFEEIKQRVTGDIGKLNERLLRISRAVLRDAKDHRAIKTPPGMIVLSFFRKAVNTFEAIEALKKKRLIEECWILLRVLLETHVNLVYFMRNDPREMTLRYLDASLLEKIKHLREVSYYQGTPMAAEFDRGDWEKKAAEIRGRYDKANFEALRRNGFSCLSFEKRAEIVGLKALYQYCYRIASRSVHTFDPAETPVFGVAFRGKRPAKTQLLRARREQLEANQNALLGRLAFLISEFTRNHRSLELILIAAGYDKFLDNARTGVRQSPRSPGPAGTWMLWPF